MTVWRPIPGFSRYSASDDGRVRRDVQCWRTPAGEAKQQTRLRGEIAYRYVSMTDDGGKHMSVGVHVAVAAAWIGPRPDGAVVRHLNGNSLDNSPGNIAYGTHTDNVRDSIEHGTQVRGSRQHLAKLGEQEVRQFKLDFLAGESVAVLARRHGISKTNAYDIVRGRIWTHVEPAGDLRVGTERPRLGYRGQVKTSQHKGVSLDRRTGKWVASRHVAGKRKHLGEFATELAAAEAVAAYQGAH